MKKLPVVIILILTLRCGLFCAFVLGLFLLTAGYRSNTSLAATPDFNGEIGDNVKLHVQYGKAILFSGDYEKAKVVLQDIVAQNPGNLEAKVLLADAFAYNQEFDVAIKLYGEVLLKSDTAELKKRLADTLVWNRDYDAALALYDEMLSEKKNVGIRLQKARALDFAKRHNASQKEYQKILGIEHSDLVELEMRGKEAAWDKRTKETILCYSELLEKDPENLEIKYDLSQLYSHLSMWKKAIREYEEILDTRPRYHGAAEGLQKATMISSGTLVHTGYDYFKASSGGRQSDVNKHTFYTNVSLYPFHDKLRVDGNYSVTARSFTDFENVVEHEGAIKFDYSKNPDSTFSGFYDFILYDRGIETMHTFGAAANFRVLDVGWSSFSYERERLENTSEVLWRNFYKDNFKARFSSDVGRKLTLGVDYLYSDYHGNHRRFKDRSTGYSYDNHKYELGYDMCYSLLDLEHYKFTAKYRFFFRDFHKNVHEYFSPQSYNKHEATFKWRHFLFKEDVFFGASQHYYDLDYTVSRDKVDVKSHQVKCSINWDVGNRLNLNMEGFFTDSSFNIYKDRGVSASITFNF